MTSGAVSHALQNEMSLKTKKNPKQKCGQGGTGAVGSPPCPGRQSLHPWVPPPSGSDLHHSPHPRAFPWGLLFSRGPLEHKFKSVINFPLSSSHLFAHFK